MTLEVSRTSEPGVLAWSILYGGQAPRRYLLRATSSPILFKLDERNSIVLDCFLVRESLYCSFSLNRKAFLFSYRRTGSGVVVQAVMSTKEATTTSGGAGNVPAVGSHGLVSVQRGLLRKL